MKFTKQFLQSYPRRFLFYVFIATLIGFGVSYFSLFQQPSVSFAQSDTEEAEETEEKVEEEETTEATSATTQSLKDRIEKVVEEKEARSQTEDQNIVYTTRGIVGQVERVSESTISIATARGSVIIPVDKTVELLQDDKLIEISQIEIENSIIVLGLQTGETFTPIKIIISKQSLLPRRQIVQLGTVTEIDQKQLSLQTRNNQSTIEFTLGNSTAFLDADDNEIEVEDLFDEIQIIVAGYISGENDNEKNQALIIKTLVELES
jgi:ElaB/YqjD/DUF883 family membrane-anchored ribosome-binding protein